MHTEDENWKLGIDLLQLLQEFQAVPASQREVENYQVPVLLGYQAERFRGGAGLAKTDGTGLLAQNILDAVPNHFVIVDDENVPHGSGIWDTGMRRVTAVPFPSAPWISIVPPAR